MFGATLCYAQQPAKVSHAEPLYLDLVRDLGARKGEKELNAGLDFRRSAGMRAQTYLLEYEFAPVDRLGLEVEADFSVFKRNYGDETVSGSRIEGLRFSSQYSFFVSPRTQTTLAAGYTQVIEFSPFGERNSDAISGMVYNPFFIAAKRWGKSIHSLLYFSPSLAQDFAEKRWTPNFQLNASLHYSFSEAHHTIGLETNSEIEEGKLSVVFRPQLKIKLSEKLALGLVKGFPLPPSRQSGNLFFRVIYEL